MDLLFETQSLLSPLYIGMILPILSISGNTPNLVNLFK